MMKVFIADDSNPLRQRLVQMISELDGMEVVGEADNGTAAIEAMASLEPDILILDIRMPYGNGITALRTIREAGMAPVVIMLTNYPYPQYRKKCMEEGADYFLDKSNEFECIPDILRTLGVQRQRDV
jgi:DNA-binding NarL/FixJ family response regulator